MAKYVMSIDQGTTSTRCILFDHQGASKATHQLEHAQHTNSDGWVEHDPMEIWDATKKCMQTVVQQAGLYDDAVTKRIAAIGITNQRETTIVWDKTTGEPVYNAIVWQDSRTQKICEQVAKNGKGGVDRFRSKTGLPIVPYFSATKIKWILENVTGAHQRAEEGKLLFGTIDTWLVWNLTGGTNGGIHVTDPTNAQRTLLMNINKLTWDASLCAEFGIPQKMLPEIKTSSEEYGKVDKSAVPGVGGVPIAGILGDQNAALFGQACFDPGCSKSTYGTGCFLLQNTGTHRVESKHNLLTIVAYKLPNQPCVYGLEGSVAVAGSLVQWMRDKLKFMSSAHEIETIAKEVEDNGGVYFVPAFTGLFAPYWRTDARGVIVGLTHNSCKGHIARAAIEATAFQCQEVIACMQADSGLRATELRVDGGMVQNELLCQFQADVSEKTVVRPKIIETTALGAAYAAGLAVGFWDDFDELRKHWAMERKFSASKTHEEVCFIRNTWQRAIKRSLGWHQEGIVGRHDHYEKDAGITVPAQLRPTISERIRSWFTSSTLITGVSALSAGVVLGYVGANALRHRETYRRV